MLAKVWKKALLAICIIACLYNVMHKLISRTSLEVQLKSVESKTSVMDSGYEENSLKIEEEKVGKEIDLEEDEESQGEDKDTIVVIQ